MLRRSRSSDRRRSMRRTRCSRRFAPKKIPPGNSGWRVTGRDPQTMRGSMWQPARVGGTRPGCRGELVLVQPLIELRVSLGGHFVPAGLQIKLELVELGLHLVAGADRVRTGVSLELGE